MEVWWSWKQIAKLQVGQGASEPCKNKLIEKAVAPVMSWWFSVCARAHVQLEKVHPQMSETMIYIATATRIMQMQARMQAHFLFF